MSIGKPPRPGDLEEGMEIPVRSVNYDKTEWGIITGLGNWGFAVRVPGQTLRFRWGQVSDDYDKIKLVGVSDAS